MADAARNQIDLLKSLTRELLISARAGEWDKTTLLETERRPLLYQVFGMGSTGQHVQHQALLQEILSADREIMQLAEQRRDELGNLLQQVGHGRTALKAYESNRR